MFEFLGSIFTAILYRPLFNLLVFIYDILPNHDFGLAIVILTLIIRFILYPLTIGAVRSQKVLQKLQPHVKAIQEKHKDDKEKQARETLELYRKERINPFSGFLLALVQLPILIALYSVFRYGTGAGQLNNLYAFVPNPTHLGTGFLGLLDLARPNWIFAGLAGILQFFQTKMLLPKAAKQQKKDDVALIVQNQMVYFFPFITVIILGTLPSALGLYWIVSGIFSIVQQYFIIKKMDTK